jgi:hypothetical protein
MSGLPGYQTVAIIMYFTKVALARTAGISLALRFVILHDTPASNSNESVQMRQNELYNCGKITLTALRPVHVPHRVADLSTDPVQEADHCQQICRSKHRPTRGDNHERINWRQVRPTRRD